MEEKGLVKTVGVELTIQEVVQLRNLQLAFIKSTMKENIHFGRIPGTPKPSLWQPGAQLLDTLHGYATTFEPLGATEDWDKGFFAYDFRCRIIRRRDGMLVGEGIGHCNSREKKYRVAVYHGDDEGIPVDPRDNVNTYKKMACKRAHIAATLNATGLADIFTQDTEDMIDQFVVEGEYKEDSVEPNRSEHFCKTHGVPFFKKGKMKWWAHKIEGTDKWCSESQVKKAMAKDASEGVEEEKPEVVIETKSSQDELPQAEDIHNQGDLMNAAYNYWNLSPSQVLKELNVKNATQITNVGEAWLTICAPRKAKI